MLKPQHKGHKEHNSFVAFVQYYLVTFVVKCITANPSK